MPDASSSTTPKANETAIIAARESELAQREAALVDVDDLEDDVSRLHLTVWQELDVAEHGVLDSLSADRRCHGLAVQRFGGFDGLCPNLYGGGAERRALVGSSAIGLRIGGDEGGARRHARERRRVGEEDVDRSALLDDFICRRDLAGDLALGVGRLR